MTLDEKDMTLSLFSSTYCIVRSITRSIFCTTPDPALSRFFSAILVLVVCTNPLIKAHVSIHHHGVMNVSAFSRTYSSKLS